MALRWQWENCIGELEIENQNKARIRVYQGNALLIFLNEWQSEKGESLWSMYNFFADKGHFDNCRKDKEYFYRGYPCSYLHGIPIKVCAPLRYECKTAFERLPESVLNDHRYCGNP